MNFTVTLNNPFANYHSMVSIQVPPQTLIKKIEADEFYVESGMVFFNKDKSQVACFQSAHVLYIERDKQP